MGRWEQKKQGSGEGGRRSFVLSRVSFSQSKNSHWNGTFSSQGRREREKEINCCSMDHLQSALTLFTTWWYVTCVVGVEKDEAKFYVT